MQDAGPQIDAVEASDSEVVIRLTVHEHLSWFQGHFDGCPLLPGVVQIKWAIELGRAHLRVAGDFRDMSGIKFMRLIQPGTRLRLHLRYKAQRRELRFEYRDDDATYAVGNVLFGAAA
jgi:3-hydroxymyristoyl/3-hydroxydecanoyl-(acyl carrier protein) dehydratase